MRRDGVKWWNSLCVLRVNWWKYVNILLLCVEGEEMEKYDNIAHVRWGWTDGGMLLYCLCVLRVNRDKNVMTLLVCFEGDQMEECDDPACVCWGWTEGGMWWYCFCVLMENRWINVMTLLVFAEGENMEECDKTACLCWGWTDGKMWWNVLCVLKVKAWRNLMICLVCAEVELMEESGDTASQNDESSSQIFDSDFDPNYSWNFNPYSDCSFSNRFSLFDGNVCVLNLTQFVYFTTGKRNRISNIKKIYITIRSRWIVIATNWGNTESELFKNYWNN